MSFDVHFQGFRDGDAAPAGGVDMWRLLEPHVVREEQRNHFALVEYGDGSVDVYLDDDHMMANHVVGERPWDLLVNGARAADWVILPVGCSTSITRESQRAHLPAGLDESVILVSSGTELSSAIRSVRP